MSAPEPLIRNLPARGPSEPAFMQRVRLRARRYIGWLQHQWASVPGGMGLSISPLEVDRILAGTSSEAELAFYSADPDARALSGPIANADAACAADPRMARLRDALALSEAELDLLSLTVAVEADPWLRRAFGYIHDDATATLPTLWLARQLFQWPAGTAVPTTTNLVRWRLARPLDAQSSAVTSPWLADPAIARALIDDRPFTSDLADVVIATHAPRTCVYPAELRVMTDLVHALEATAPSLQVVLAGPSGAGKRTLVTQLCAELGIPLLIVDASTMCRPTVDPAPQHDWVVRIVRAARLADAAVYWHGAERAPELGDMPPRLSILGTTRSDARTHDAVRTIRLPSLSRAARVALWSTFGETEPPFTVLDWPLLPADIARAAARIPAGPDAVIEACRNTLGSEVSTLATALPRPYGWDDLVVPPGIRRHLDELESQARLRWPVYEDWGFGKHFPLGHGIAALFAGPSGTGKTMAAQVLARSLGMECYRIDLAGVMSKYIGETEKNLRQVFDACERANVLLFFDEADALFGQRMQVKDAHDRFANIEIDYLLQRMEQFDGISVLATNRKNEIDQAFLRRIRFIIDFLPPGIPERRELWKRALPARTPSGQPLLADIDNAVLADRLEMTGAEIKNTATGAAFLARAENKQISMKHVFRAARRELAKRGIVLRGEVE